MVDIPSLKRACIDVLDFDDEDGAMSMATFHAFATPETILELANILERISTPEELDEMLDMMRQLVQFVESVPGEEARTLAMRAKVYSTK